MYLPSSGKWTLLTVALLALGGAVATMTPSDTMSHNGKTIFLILWITSLIVCQMIGFVSWSKFRLPQQKRTAPTFTIWLLCLNVALIVIGAMVAETDFLDDTDKTIFFVILVPLSIILYVLAFHRWWKSRIRLQRPETGGFSTWHKSLSPPQQEETIQVALMEKDAIPTPSRDQRSRPVIVRMKR